MVNLNNSKHKYKPILNIQNIARYKITFQEILNILFRTEDITDVIDIHTKLYLIKDNDLQKGLRRLITVY